MIILSRVPRIHRFSTDRAWLYIVMGYVKGHVKDPFNDSHLIAKVAQVLDYLSTLAANHPGNLGGWLSWGFSGLRRKTQLSFDDGLTADCFQAREIPSALALHIAPGILSGNQMV
ncbi:unnamed protein product [Penicillium roqueforti FM164]|uniref:Genomic scaffold, ProqFM164S01 n=1 Tax=Penicillium roqueforti (strain FM164) TaxID=1365484 RepID=W6QFJ5_PENRF|nr:unnamed protein product [Penicillium roqueforti FM164]